MKKNDTNWDGMDIFLEWLHTETKETKNMSNTTRKIGDEVLVNGFWVVIVELFEDGYAFVRDQDGEEFEVFLN